MKAIRAFFLITILIFGSISVFAQTDTSRTKYNRDRDTNTRWQDKDMNESRDINNRDMEQPQGQDMDQQGEQNKNVNSQDRDQRNLNQGVYEERTGVENPQERTDAPGRNQVDLDFVTDASSAGMMELEVSRLAAEKATNPRVRSFANMIIRDHQKTSTELKSVSSKKNWTVPMEMKDKHQGKIEKMKDETGADFDRKYIDFMVDDHQSDLDKYKKQSIDGNDAELRTYAAKTVPVLQMHLDSAKAIKRDLDRNNKMFKKEDKDKTDSTKDKNTKTDNSTR